MPQPKQPKQPKPKPDQPVDERDRIHIVPLENLQRSHVYAVDAEGRKYRLEPQFKVGEYSLAYVPEVK